MSDPQTTPSNDNDAFKSYVVLGDDGIPRTFPNQQIAEEWELRNVLCPRI